MVGDVTRVDQKKVIPKNIDATNPAGVFLVDMLGPAAVAMVATLAKVTLMSPTTVLPSWVAPRPSNTAPLAGYKAIPGARTTEVFHGDQLRGATTSAPFPPSALLPPLPRRVRPAPFTHRHHHHHHHGYLDNRA